LGYGNLEITKAIPEPVRFILIAVAVFIHPALVILMADISTVAISLPALIDKISTKKE
jgi:hypothetical protein